MRVALDKTYVKVYSTLTMLNVINITQARQNLSQLIDEIIATQQPRVLIRESRPEAVIIPYTQYAKEKENWNREFMKLKTEARKQFTSYLAKQNTPYPKTEEVMYAIIDKL